LIIAQHRNPKGEQRKGTFASHFVLPCDIASKFLDAKAADDDPVPRVLPEAGGSSGPGPGRATAKIVDGGSSMVLPTPTG
jgi:hypothetical protein